MWSVWVPVTGSDRTQRRGRITSFLCKRRDLFMSCPHCLSTSTSKSQHRTSLGYRTFYCQDCNRRFNQRSGTPFSDLQFPTDIVLLAVLWRLRYKLSFRDVAALLLQRGFEISHETIRTWEFRFAPLVSENLRIKRRGTAGVSWYLDETYIKVSGRWRYLYRAIDQEKICLIRCSVRTRTSTQRVVSCDGCWIVLGRSHCG